MTKIQRWQAEIRYFERGVREARAAKHLTATTRRDNVRSALTAIRHRRAMIAEEKKRAKK